MPNPERWETKTQGVRFRVRFRQDGIHRSRTFPTRPEAAQFCRMIDAVGVARAVHELDAERAGLDEMTLDQWAQRHFASLSGVTPGTLTTYRRIYARTWSPPLGQLRLSQIDRETLARTVLAMPGSDKTIKNAWGVLAHMLKMAVVDGHLVRSPGIGVKLPKRSGHETLEHRYLTHTELWQLIDDTPPYWRPFVWMLAGTGMRWGEAVALQVGDVDLDTVVQLDDGTLVPRPTVRVTKAEKWDAGNRGERVIGPPKTRRSRRTIALPVEVADTVRPLVDGRKSTAPLFTAPRGGTVQHRTFYSDIWRKKCTANLPAPPPRIHDLRHSHVAWLIAENTPLPVIQARLGHEKITTTIDTYGHLLPDVQAAAADAASAAFGRGRRVPAATPLELPSGDAGSDLV